jgi:hypothetical protein
VTPTMTSTPFTAAASTTVRDIVARIHELAVCNGDRIAVIDAYRTVTYGELWQAGRKAAAEQRPGDQLVVPVAARPTAATIIAALGVWLAGGIPMPVPATARTKLLDAVAGDADSVGHWCQPWRAHLHAEPGGRHVHLAGGESPTDPRVAGEPGAAVTAAPVHANVLIHSVGVGASALHMSRLTRTPKTVDLSERLRGAHRRRYELARYAGRRRQ